MGAVLEFKYMNRVGKPVGHNVWIKDKEHFLEVLGREALQPEDLKNLKVNGKPMDTKILVNRLSGSAPAEAAKAPDPEPAKETKPYIFCSSCNEYEKEVINQNFFFDQFCPNCNAEGAMKSKRK